MSEAEPLHHEQQDENPLIDALPYSDFDQLQFERLIAQESHSVEGQAEMMSLVLQMINERLERREARIRAELQQDGVPADKLEERVAHRMADVAVYDDEYRLDDGRNNIVVEIGTPLHMRWKTREERDAIREKEVTLMVPAHCDAVKPTNETQLQLSADPNNEDTVMGRGVWDMKGAALNMLHYIEHLEVPHGMRVYLVFTVDEEGKSKGAEMITRHWRRMKFVDIVFSNEIGPTKNEQGPNGEEKIINAICRRGRAKFRITLSVTTRKIDHGAAGNAPNAVKAMRHVLNTIDGGFPLEVSEFTYGKTEQVPGSIQSIHELLGPDDLEEGPIASTEPDPSAYVAPSSASYRFSIATVPPSTCENILEQIQERLDALKLEKGWNELGIKCDVRRISDQTSYDPYEMPKGHPIVSILTDIQHKITGVLPVFEGAPSVADEVLYAKALQELRSGRTSTHKTDIHNSWAVVSSQMTGGNAHGASEWLSKSSMVRHRQVFQNLVQHPDGLWKFVQEDVVAQLAHAIELDDKQEE